MTQEPDINIDLQGEHQKFKNYLDGDNSQRVIFSAPFGSGKTHFLNDFFKGTDYSEYYLPIHLHPVNYSVAQNEDIFELIKFDILFEIWNQYWNGVNPEDISNWMIAWGYLKENPIAIFNDLVKIAGKVGFEIAGLSSISTIFSKVSEHHQKIKNKQDEQSEDKVIKEYIKSFHKQSGGIRENDDETTKLINSLLSKLKKDRTTILVIDDLDRIDPDHIFRILNVFAAHFDVVHFNSEDQKTGDNKFGFDKVILSCDVNNIRKIFSNRYGQDVDFSGYIDKFYTKEIFEYDIKRLVRQEIDKILNSLKILPYPNSGRPQNYDYLTNPNIIDNTRSFLGTLIDYNELTIRKLKAVFSRSHLSVENFTFRYPNSNNKDNSLNIYSIQLFQFLEAIFGNRDNVKAVIYRMSQKITNYPTSLYLENEKALQLEALLGFLLQNQNIPKNRQSEDEFIQFNLKSSDYKFKAKFRKIDRFLNPFCEWDLKEQKEGLSNENNTNLAQFRVNSFEVMDEAFELYDGIYKNRNLT